MGAVKELGITPGLNGRRGQGDVGREETLDPADWEDFRSLAHEMIDTMIDYQRDVRGTPAYRAVPGEVDERFREPVPEHGLGARGAYGDFKDLVLPYPTGLHHPRFWGWAGGTGNSARNDGRDARGRHERRPGQLQ